MNMIIIHLLCFTGVFVSQYHKIDKVGDCVILMICPYIFSLQATIYHDGLSMYFDYYTAPAKSCGKRSEENASIVTMIALPNMKGLILIIPQLCI